MATQSKAQLKLHFFQIETVIRSRLARILEKIDQRRSHCFGTEPEDDNRSEQFLQMQKNLNSLTCKNNFRVLQYDTSFWIQQWEVWNQPNQELLTTNFRKRTTCWTDCYQKTIQFVSFKFCNVQLLDLLSFLRCSTKLDSFPKAYKASETSGIFPYQWFNHPDNLNDKELPP